MRVAPASAALLAALALVGCTAGAPTDPPPGQPPGPDALAQVGRWTLQGATGPDGSRIDAAFPHGRAVHAAVFAEGTLGLQGGCNHIGGDYRVEGDGTLVVGPMRSTKRACEDTARMEADAAVSALVEGRADWRIAESWPEQLYMDHDDGSRSHWVADRTE
jgi:heat shock protein HslJ